VLSGKPLVQKNVRTLDIAKRLLDYGYYAPTIYFPLIVEEAIMIEPTETESKATLDEFAATLKKILDEHGLAVSTVNLNVKGEAKWRVGSFSSRDASIRKEAVQYLKTAMDCAALLSCNLVTTALLNDGSDYPFELEYARAFNHMVEGVT
jgi:glycine cleavage system protein P-like pyridoxal-binding family